MLSYLRIANLLNVIHLSKVYFVFDSLRILKYQDGNGHGKPRIEASRIEFVEFALCLVKI